MMKLQLDPNHWCVVRCTRKDGSVRSDGTCGLVSALNMAAHFINTYGVTKVTVFDGQPSDGAKVVAIIDLEGVSDG